jgi:hypothetical protein
MPILTLQGLTMSVLCALMLAYCVCTTIHRIRTQRPPDEALSKRKSDPETLGILYQTGQQNLVSFKESQWSITNYSLLAIAAVVAVFTIAWDSHFLVDFLKYTAVVLVVAIAGFGAVLVTDLQLGIRAHRVSINQMKKALFPQPMPGYPGLTQETIDRDKKFFRGAELPVLYYVSILLGLLFAIVLIVIKAPAQ